MRGDRVAEHGPVVAEAERLRGVQDVLIEHVLRLCLLVPVFGKQKLGYIVHGPGLDLCHDLGFGHEQFAARPELVRKALASARGLRGLEGLQKMLQGRGPLVRGPELRVVHADFGLEVDSPPAQILEEGQELIVVRRVLHRSPKGVQALLHHRGKDEGWAAQVQLEVLDDPLDHRSLWVLAEEALVDGLRVLRRLRAVERGAEGQRRRAVGSDVQAHERQKHLDQNGNLLK
mmetsp:Transcript_71757/g.181306  ORF Transcript_71757/g.181306 Transcript_71757/m.181306 type:complete len:231 (-) Transcript_71757:44-736(-)